MKDTIEHEDALLQSQVVKNQKDKGAFNMFVANNNQSPADIAGDLNHYICLQYMVEHFQEHEVNNIRAAFITDEIKHKYADKRFETKPSHTITFSDQDTEPQTIKLSFL